MGVSFKISRTGTRFRPKLLQIEGSPSSNIDNDGAVAEGDYTNIGGNVADHANVMVNSGLHSALKDLEASFSLNLFPDGFSVGKITEVFKDLPGQLHPYDRASKTVFSAIEYGWLPGQILDDLPCKYINGAVLCEVRDHRKCLFSKVDDASAEKSPVVHKVMLHMCMENVVKDLLSLSDDSWTYGDLLEAESCILKALQPDLHLNPQLALDRNPPTKKLDLGITWSWNKRELNPPPAINLNFNNLCNVTSNGILGINGVQSSNSELFQAYQDSGLSSLEQFNPSITSLCNPLTSDTTCQMTDSYNQPALEFMTNPTNLVSVPIKVVANSSNRRNASFSGVGGSTGCITQATEEHILKKPKTETEPVEFDLDSEFHWWNDMLQRRAMVDEFQFERSLVKSGLLMSQGNNQQVLKVLPMPLTVKQEPVETCNSSEVEKRNDKDTAMCQRSNQSSHQQPRMKYLPPSVRDNIATNAPGNQLDLYLGKKSRENSGPQKRKPLVNPQVSIRARNESSSYFHNEVMQSEASRPGKRPKKSRGSKGCEVVDSLDCTSNYDAANLIGPRFCNLPLRQPSTVKCDPDSLFDRFKKVKMMTERHGLNKQKCKLDCPLQKKAVFHKTPLIALHLSNCDGNQNSEQTRTFTFVRPGDSEIDYEARVKLVLSKRRHERMAGTCVLYQPTKENDSIDVPITPSFPSTLFTDLFAAQFKSLMVREGYSLGSDQIEPTLLYSDDNLSNHQQSVPSNDIPQVEIVGQHLPTLASRPSPVMQRPTDMSTFHDSHLSQDIWSRRYPLPPGSTIQLSANPIMKPQLDNAGKGCSTNSPNPFSKSQLGNISRKGNSVQSQNPISKMEIDLAGKGYSNPLSKSKLDIDVKRNSKQSYYPLSKQKLDIVAKGNPMQFYNPLSTTQINSSDKGHHIWQQILTRQAHLQFQMQQTQRQIEQIMKQKAEVGRLGLAACEPGRMQSRGGIQGLGNIGLASLSGLLGTGGSMPSRIPWTGNVGQLNNLSDSLLSSNESKQFSSYPAASDDPTNIIPNPRMPSGVHIPTNAGVVPMQKTNVLDMAGNLNHQQLSRLPQEQSLQKRVGEAMSSSFQSPEAGFLPEHVPVMSSPPSQGNFQQSETNSQQLFPGFLYQCPESQDLSLPTHGSMGSSSNASSNKLLDFHKNNNAASGDLKCKWRRRQCN